VYFKGIKTHPKEGENISSAFVKIVHIDGKINLADFFTKEMKDINHFVTLRNLMMCSRLIVYVLSFA